MTIGRSKRGTTESREAALSNGPTFSPRTADVKLYDNTGQSVGIFAHARDAFAALDELDSAV